MSTVQAVAPFGNQQARLMCSSTLKWWKGQHWVTASKVKTGETEHMDGVSGRMEVRSSDSNRDELFCKSAFPVYLSHVWSPKSAPEIKEPVVKHALCASNPIGKPERQTHTPSSSDTPSGVPGVRPCSTKCVAQCAQKINCPLGFGMRTVYSYTFSRRKIMDASAHRGTPVRGSSEARGGSGAAPQN